MKIFRKRTLGIAVFLAAGLVGAQKPNMVVIMVDDMGYECIGANGCAEYSTPVVDRLAADGLRFSNAHSTPVCTPTRTQIMSGRYGHRNYTRFGRFVESEICFAERLRDAGYATMIAGKWQLGGYDLDTTVDDFGFDEYALYNLPGFENANYKSSNSGRYWDPSIFTNGGVEVAATDTDYGPDIYTDFAIDFIERKAGDQPFLVYYAMALTHNPFVPTPHSDFAWPAGGAREIYDTMDKEKWFKDEVEYCDYLVGRIMQALEDAGVSDNTIVIFTGDNGTNSKYPVITTMKDGGVVVGGKNTTKKTGTHVPFILDWPAVDYPTNEISALYDHSDMLPTLVELAGAEMPGNREIDGISMAPIIRGETVTHAREAVFCEWFGGGRRKHSLRDFALDERWKYYINGEFYDMDMDPEEISPVPEEDMTPEMAAARDKLRDKIVQVYSSKEDDGQMVTNPGFEDGFSKWRHVGKGWAASNGLAAVVGRPSDPEGRRWLYQYYPAHPGQLYDAAADVLTSGLDAGEAKAWLQIDFYDRDDNILATRKSSEITEETSSARVLYVDAARCPLHAQYMRLSVMLEPIGGSEFNMSFDRMLLRTGKLRNPDAEFQNNAGWVMTDRDWTVSNSSDDTSSGSFGFSTTVFGREAAETGSRAFSQTTEAVPGEMYTLSADVCSAGRSGNLELSGVYVSGDGAVMNQVKSDGSVNATDRPNVGAFSTGGFNGFWFFELPTIPSDSAIRAIRFDAPLVKVTDKGGLANFDMYAFGQSALGANAGNYQETTGVPRSGDEPSNWTGTRVADNLITPDSYDIGAMYSISNSALLSVVQGLYGSDGQPEEGYLVLRGQMDWDTDNVSETQRYRLNSHRDGQNMPVLNLSVDTGGRQRGGSEGYIRAEFLAADGSVLATHQSGSITNDTAFLTVTMTNLVAPAGTAFIRIGGGVDVPSELLGNEYWSFDNFRLNDSRRPDLDRDGSPDGEEEASGTDPEVPSSLFSVEKIRCADGVVEVEWSPVSGRTYDVLWSPLLDSDFQQLATGIDYPTGRYVHVLGTNVSGFLKLAVRMKKPI